MGGYGSKEEPKEVPKPPRLIALNKYIENLPETQ